jgi:hypothetical protein
MNNHEAYFDQAHEVVRLWTECRKHKCDPVWVAENSPHAILTPNARVEFSEEGILIAAKNTYFDLYDLPGDPIENIRRELYSIMKGMYPEGPAYLAQRHAGVIRACCLGYVNGKEELLFTIEFENGEILAKLTSISLYDIAAVLTLYDNIQNAS